MIQATFNEILEASDQLPLEDQENLIQILQNRVREQKRVELIKEVKQADEEFRQGKCKALTPEEIMEEIFS